jgi:galactokinase
LSEEFSHLFGRHPDVCADAPGRVNLIGEHTDYNGGYVLPTVLPYKTEVQIGRRHDRVVRGASLNVPGSPVAYHLGDETRSHGWIDYVKGVTWALASAGYPTGGFDFVVSSTVPIGKGLSSSASLEVAMCRALRSAFQLRLTDLDIAMASHRAEAQFVGAPVGIMDQIVCSLGDSATAVFLDAATAAYESIPLPQEMEFGVVDSGIAHHHASGNPSSRQRQLSNSETGVRGSSAAARGVAVARPVIKRFAPDRAAT